MRTIIVCILALFAIAAANAQVPIPTTINMTTTASAANTGTSVTVAVTASDAASGINSVTIMLDGASATSCPFTAVKTPAICNATVTWVAGTVPHTILSTATNALGLILTSSVVFKS
ncbi:MAG: hypothetical protein JWP25_8964 [Bradyrhizobium sp.]|nr:hypothetical protein [Bradyrhizobium sp.]